MKTMNIARVLIVTGLILLVPLVAMQFTEEVDWGLLDFVVMGSLLLATGFTYEIATKKADSQKKIVIGLVLLFALLLVWAELAVGIIGTPFAGS